MSRQTLCTVQAMVLLIYGISHTHGESWALLGMTYNMAVAIGCHVDPEHFNLSPLDCENRRRCWAGLMMLYTIQSIASGNVEAPRISGSVQLPANIDDDQLTDALTLLEDSPRATQMTYMLFKFRLYGIYSRICLSFYGEQALSAQTLSDLEREINLERESWNARYLRDLQTQSLPAHHMLQLHILDGYSHQLVLLLHRPFFVNPSLCSTWEQSKASREKCIKAARQMLELHRSIDQSPLFLPYRWYSQGVGSFHAFHAAVVLAAVLSSPADDGQDQELQILLMETLQTFRDMAPRSRICAKAEPALRRLLSVSLNHSSFDNATNAAESESIQIQKDILRVSYDHRIGPWPESQRHASSLMNRLQPRYWLSPSTVPWDLWETFADGLNL
ncbi:Transcription factor fungi [Macrophomina phaseolina MS6]|uniref:Transcription factor fungi n=1 Tax=Macrophomina phaseolina (strain MS6) TaxID=1126212 RepID=K2SDY8_MACPH|nr:Transcription factor fungi [Macrophomina phaseolina MS6]